MANIESVCLRCRYLYNHTVVVGCGLCIYLIIYNCVCANLFDIVNTGQHPDASVVEDGEFLCQFLLAGLDHSPRHLGACFCSVKSPKMSPEK